RWIRWHSGIVSDGLIVDLHIFVAKISDPFRLQRIFVQAIELAVEGAKVNAIAGHHWGATHSGETVYVFVVSAQIPAKGCDGLTRLNLNLMQCAPVASLCL